MKEVDPATILFSGENMHASVVVVEEDGSEVMGDSDWPDRCISVIAFSTTLFFSRSATVVDYGERNFFHIVNDVPYKAFDQHIYVLTKQRCSCQC